MYMVVAVFGGVVPPGPDPGIGAAFTVYVPAQVEPLVTITVNEPSGT